VRVRCAFGRVGALVFWRCLYLLGASKGFLWRRFMGRMTAFVFHGFAVFALAVERDFQHPTQLHGSWFCELQCLPQT